MITWFGRRAALMCDGKCHKAWGINNRPSLQLSNDCDDVLYLSDDECGEAPAHPGTWEGAHTKPTCESEYLNKWCARECERSVIVEDYPDSPVNIIELGFDRAVFNMWDRS